MDRNRDSHPGTLNVFGFAVGCALAGFIVRIMLLPTGLAGRASALSIVEGDIGGYIVKALVFGLFVGIAGAIIAFIHNEFAKRS
jgi:hypothetical protein